MHIKIIGHRKRIVRIIYFSKTLCEKLLKSAKSRDDRSRRNDVADNRQDKHHSDHIRNKSPAR